MVTALSQWKKALSKSAPKPTQKTYAGVVKSVAADGAYLVDLNGSGVLTRCEPYCEASIGDTVRVLVENRIPTAIAKRR